MLIKTLTKTLHPFCSVHLEQVSNNRNDNKSQVNGVRLTKESLEYCMWEDEMDLHYVFCSQYGAEIFYADEV